MFCKIIKNLYEREWHIIFNAISVNNVVDAKITKYFLIGNRDHDHG